MKPALSFLIPTYNDEETIESLIRRADEIGTAHARKYEIVVVNDASTDKTPDVLAKVSKRIPRLRVLTHDINKGYGQTIKELYYTGTMDYLFSVPGDNQIDPAEVLKLLRHREKADMIIGRRMNRSDTLPRKIQSRTYNALLQILFQIPTDDVNSVRLIHKRMMTSIHLTSTSPFVDAELVICAVRKGFRIIEVPIVHKSRTTEGATGGSLTRTILPTIKDLITFRFTGMVPDKP